VPAIIDAVGAIAPSESTVMAKKQGAMIFRFLRSESTREAPRAGPIR
jgi:hypothetical protein